MWYPMCAECAPREPHTEGVWSVLIGRHEATKLSRRTVVSTRNLVWVHLGLVLSSVALGDPPFAVYEDAAGDAALRRMDPGGDGVCDLSLHPLIDLLAIRIGRWEPLGDDWDLFNGEFDDDGEFLRLDLVLDGLVNPPGDTDPDPARIRTALRACRQAAGLSKRLLDFASGAHGQPQSLALPEVVELILTSLDTSLFQGIDVRTHYASHAMVRIDRDQFTQVVLNLIRNACDAMPDGGVLDIKVESLSVGNVDEGATPHPHVVLTVADTGIGMTPEAKKRVFEPFFTTKSRNARPGRGLGMATVFAAVKAARGFIETESELGAGTTFRVYLPEAIRMQEAPDAGSRAAPARGDDYESPSGSRNERT